MQTQAAVPGLATCPDCGALNTTRFCGECGRALQAAAVAETTPGLLREGLSEALGVEKGVWLTLRDLLIRPARVIEAYWSGEAVSYVRPFKLFFLLAGTYILLLSFAQPMEFDMNHLLQGDAEQRQKITALLAEKNITQDVLNDRFAQRLNTVLPLISALILLPLAAVLRRMKPERPLRDHVLFMTSITNAMWIACILLMPLTLLGRGYFLAGAQAVGIGYLVWGISRMYAGRTRALTVARAFGFVVADYLLTIPLMLLVQILVMTSIFLF